MSHIERERYNVTPELVSPIDESIRLTQLNKSDDIIRSANVRILKTVKEFTEDKIVLIRINRSIENLMRGSACLRG